MAYVAVLMAVVYLVARYATIGYLRWRAGEDKPRTPPPSRSAGHSPAAPDMKARPGQIVLMHGGSHPEDGSTLDADALPAIIGGPRSAGTPSSRSMRY